MGKENSELDLRLSQLVNQELNAFYAYQSAVLGAQEGTSEFNWIFVSKKHRQEAISELIKSLPSFKAEANRSIEVGRFGEITNIEEVAHQLYQLEQTHSRGLQKIRDDFYCPPEIKKIIDETLLPISMNNIRIIKDQRKPDLTSNASLLPS